MAIYSEFFPLKMVIFHSYVSLPEGNPTKKCLSLCFGPEFSTHLSLSPFSLSFSLHRHLVRDYPKVNIHHMKGVPWNKETSYISVYINKYDNMCKKTI